MTKQKPKLLVWCDFLVATGFGNVAKNLLDTLHKEYDVYVLGINNRGEVVYDTSKYFVFPVDSSDLLGLKKLPRIVDKVKPDIIFLFQDIFHISDLIEALRKQVGFDTKIVSYFPVDGAPANLAWQNVLDFSDAVVTYTDWAIKVIRDRFPGYKDTPIHKLYHGVDLKTFFPKKADEITGLRKTFGWTNKFTVANVNRFQPRKFISGTARAFSMFAKGYKLNPENGHMMPLDRNRCELSGSTDLETHERNLSDVFLYLHMNTAEQIMGPGRANMLQAHLLNANFQDRDVNKILGLNGRNVYSGEIPDSFINDIYNAANVNISSTIGEGCGLSLIESAATGTPSIAPNNSAIPEMLGTTGHLIKNSAVFNMALDNGHWRPIVDCGDIVRALDIEYKRWKEGKVDKEIRTECIEFINKNFLWKDKVDLLKKIFVDTKTQKLEKLSEPKQLTKEPVLEA
jgi:glycosyltransferase involved in cell wall biosynthesis